jgi:hypothetical protein
MSEPNWDIRREGRAWSGDEGYSRFELTPEKFEMVDGMLFWSDEQRVTLLALLLENVGIDVALRLAPLDRWREALAAAERVKT